MILGNEESKILKMANDYHSEITDGVTQYDYETGELFGAGFTTGTIENPANPFIEVYRLPQGERGEFDCKCHESGDCPFWIENEDEYYGGHFDDDKLIDDELRIDCCIEATADDIAAEIRENLEESVRDVLSDFLGDTIEKLNDIRIAISDILEPYNYCNVRQENWEMNVLDSYVDSAIENGFTTSECSPMEYLDAEVQYIAESLSYCEEEVLQKAGCLLQEGKIDEALKVLQ